ncbi:MAG: gamma-glutamyl-gamma-aminobutyrate hydrolase family protein [Gulosibacter sp.]|uniref:gamma-glutamyl-gamma-aminobutyrate hydrolase family protein n=1 Tax=Gulosibacter sp. TaxID=2817531 RepID=UPI003F8EEFFD
MRPPVIGVVADRKSSTSGAWVNVQTDGLPAANLEVISAGGGLPMLVPALNSWLDHPEQFLDVVDGLFLAGGRDMDAGIYGAVAHPENDPPLRVRDELEAVLVRGAWERDIPVLGFCRGMQVMNVALGGTLEQHLADRLEMKQHRDHVGAFTSHEVIPRGGTLLAEMLGTEARSIASHHHQAVNRLGEGLVASAFAPDEVVEAIEDPAKRFFVGVQWHPEQQIDLDGRVLTRAFVDAATPRSA